MNFERLGAARVAPNPTRGTASLMLSLVQDDPVSLSLIDIRGRQLSRNQQDLRAGEHQLPLDLSELTEGVYTLIVQQSGQRLSLRIVRQ